MATVIPDLAITSARVPDGAEVDVQVVLEAVEGGITVLGTVTAPWTGECRRCLDEVVGMAEIDVSEVYESRPTPGETYPIEGDQIDLESVVRDAVLLHLPLAPLCREDCLGPAPEVFPALTLGEDEGEDAAGESDEGRPKDPRWGALDVLRPDPD